ncbi:MAG TPA: alginate export family protein [Planctomycetota bacterium]|nr:alginate export family protein [Planctomycetota bacterium]
MYLSLLQVQAQEPAPPPYKTMRSEEDYRYLRDPGRRTDFFDPVKYIPLDDEGETFLTLGGDLRLRYEHFRNPGWGSGPDEDGSLLQRYMFHADLHPAESFRAFVQFKSCLEYGREGGPRPADEDRLDLHQLFFDVLPSVASEDSFTLRLGRQEFQYGSSRLVSTRDGPNVRQSFDAARSILRFSNWRADAFVSRPVETDPGVFDDGPDDSRLFWGLYAVSPPKVILGGAADLYYLGLDREDAEFDQGTAHEVRHSLGARFFRGDGPVDYNFEVVYQFGRFGQGDLQAWTAASDTGLTLEELPGRPRLGLKANIASGDRDASDADLETFNPLFPRGSYFSETGLIGPANFFDLHPSLSLETSEATTLAVDWDFFWRQSTSDGIYGTALNLVRTGQSSDERYIGSQLSISLECQVDRHAELTLFYAHFFAGPFLRETPPGEDVDFLGAWITYGF